MSLPLSHALIPVAGALAFAKKPLPWKLIFCASLAAAAPDLDAFATPLFGVAKNSLFGHRGWRHSLFTALIVGVFAAVGHRRFRLPATTVAIVIGTAMASHGLLDMMTDSGQPVAYLWPLSSQRLFADWRPFPGTAANFSYSTPAILKRLETEARDLVLPLFLAATLIRLCRLGDRNVAVKS